MKIEQLTLDVIPEEDIPIKKGTKYIKMQEVYGIKEDCKCKQCKNFLIRKMGNKYFKCKLWHMTASSATDIRANETACGMFEEEAK